MKESTPRPMEVFTVLTILAISAFVVILNETIMSVALPVLMEEFSVTAATAQWLTTAFMLTMAVVIPTTGWLLTRYPLKTVFALAMILFIVGTALAGFAPTFGLLVTGRVIQASGTAIVMPLLMTTAMNLVAPDKRGRTMGVISVVISLAPAMGPTAGGLILEQLTWRWMFYSVLPIAVLAGVAGTVLMRNLIETRKIPLDIFSVFLSGLGFAGVIFGLSSLGEAATDTELVSPWIPLSVGVLALTVFTLRQISLNDHALLNLRVFAVPGFALSVAIMLVSMMGMFGVLIVMPIYMQDVLDFSTSLTGLVLLPGGLAMGLLGFIVGRLYDAVGPRPLIIPGSLLAAGGMWGFVSLDAHSTPGNVMFWHIMLSVGLSALFGPMMTNAMAVLPPRLYSHGSATVSTLQQVAAAAGTALFITVMSIVTASQLGSGVPQSEALMAGIHLAIICGASIMLVSVVGVWFIRRNPAAQR